MPNIHFPRADIDARAEADLPKRRSPTHPGEMLVKEFLEPPGVTQKGFAEHLGWTYAHLNEIIDGRRGVTAELALAIGDALKTGPEFWLNLQRNAAHFPRPADDQNELPNRLIEI